MDLKGIKVKEAQKIRDDINKIICNQIKPKREKYEQLLREIAEILCPFKVDDVITLPNKKKGKITEINCYSLDYQFMNLLDFNFFYEDNKPVDDFNYIYSTTFDDRQFSITWSVSGLRIKKDGKVGVSRFVDLSPVHHSIDVNKMQISDKHISKYISDEDFQLFDSVNNNKI